MSGKERLEVSNTPTKTQEPAKDSGDLFRDEWFAKAEQPKTTEAPKTADAQTAKPKEQGYERVQATDKTQPAAAGDQQKFIDPYEHINKATAASQELDQIAASGKKPTDTIEVKGANGQVTQMKVGDRVTQLKTEVKQAMEISKQGADSIRQTGPNGVSEMITSNVQKRDALCAELGIDKNKMTNPQQAFQELNPRFLAANQSPESKAKLQELWQTVRDRADLETLRHAPAYQRLIEAELTAKGHTNPNIKAGQETPREEVSKAFQLLKDAGRIDEELSHTELFRNAETKVTLTYATHQQDRSVQILQHMKTATEKKANPAEQEVELKKAIELADKINVGFITNQAKIPRNLESGISSELVDIVRIGSQARIDYAKFLSEQGRFSEAQSHLTQAKTDSPELIYQQNPQTKEISYRDASLQTMDNKVSQGLKTNPGSWDAAQTKFLQNLNNGDHEAAKKEFGEMQRVTELMKKEIAEANQPLKEERARLEAQKKQFEEKDQKKTITDDEKIELERVKREMDIIDKTMTGRTSQIDRQHNVTRYMDGLLAMAQDDRDRANNIFKEVKQNDPELAKIKELGLDDKIADTEGGFGGWWHRNWKYVAVGAAVVAGVAIAVGTCGLASGASAALVAGTAGALGVGTATATGIVAVGTLATATTLGAVGGGLAHLGVEKTVNKDAGWESFWNGAQIGGMSAGMVASPWAAGMLAEVGGGAAVVGTVANAGRASKIASTLNLAKDTANFFGVTKLSVGTGVAFAGAIEGGKYATGVTPTGDQALKQFGVSSLTNTLMFGLAGKIKIAGEAATAANAGRTTLPQMLGVTKGTVGLGYGSSAIMETRNVWSGEKTLEQGVKDFATNGTINTVALGLAKNAFSPVTSTNPWSQSMALGGKAFMMKEGTDVLLNQGMVRYLNHDFLGQPGRVQDDGVGLGFLGPLAANGVENMWGTGLNPLHPGERGIYQGRISDMGPEFGYTTRIDRRFLDGRKQPHKGLFFEIENANRIEK